MSAAATAVVSWTCALCDSSSAPSFTRKSTLKEHMKRKHTLDDAEADMILASITEAPGTTANASAASSPIKQEQKPPRKSRAQPPTQAAAAAPPAPSTLAATASAVPASLPQPSPPLASAHVPTMASASTVAASPLSAPAAAAMASPSPLPAAAASTSVKQEPFASPSTPMRADVAAAVSADTPITEPLTPLQMSSASAAAAAASVSPHRAPAKSAAMKRRTPATQRRQAVARAPLSDEEEEQDENAHREDEDTPMESSVVDSLTKQEPQLPAQPPVAASPVQQQLSYDPTMPPPPPSPARRVTPTNAGSTTSNSAAAPPLPLVRASNTTPGASPSTSTPSAAVPYSSSTGISPSVADAVAVQPPMLGSCHHCKNIRAISDTVQCSSRLVRRSDANGRRLPICTKRFCWACLQKNYPVSTAVVQVNPDAWTCPSCEETCFCVKCKARLAALGRTPGDPKVVQPPKPVPLPPVHAQASPVTIQRRESAARESVAPARKSHAPSSAAAPVSHAATASLHPQQQQQQPPQHSGPIRMHPPTQLVLAAGTEVSRVSPSTECHALVVQLCEPHTLSVVVRLTPELAAQQSVYPECSVHFPLPGCPLWLPPGAQYRICNLAMDDPVWVAAPKAPSTATAEGERKCDTEVSPLLQHISPGSVAVVEVWVQSSAPSAAETTATREVVSERLATLQAQAHKLRAGVPQAASVREDRDRDVSGSESSDASDDDEEYGAARNRKRKRGGSSAASSKQARAAPASAELQLLDSQIADLQAYLEGYGPAPPALQAQPQQQSSTA